METDKTQQNPTLSPDTGLTPQQEQAAMLLASGQSVTAVAQQLTINRTTLYDWQNFLPFKCYYNQQCRDSREGIKNALLGLHSTAIETLTDLLTNGNENTRLKASIWLLERIGNTDIGETRIRKALKNKCTHSTIGFDDMNRLDESEYRQELARYGLSEDIPN